MPSLLRPAVEILSPAGSETCLAAALQAGADAVYFGVEGFNLRAHASNFTVDRVPEVVAAAREHHAKAYLVVNSIIYEDELDSLDALLASAAAANIDAVIAWDMAVMQAAQRHGVPVMFSTQASVSNSEAMQFYHAQFGVTRFVLARECSLEHIRAIRHRLDTAGLAHVEIEAFAHGAMCVAISGRCFMSYEQHGKSANRGECLQPCRREYGIMSTDGKSAYTLGNDYVMSPKDLCTLPFIEQLLEAGVHSFKIEGRNRNPEYVSLTTRAYRRVIDFYLANHLRSDDWRSGFQAIKDEEMQRLQSVYHRGFSDGFYQGKPVAEWTQGRSSAATRKKLHLGRVLNYYAQPSVAHIRIEDHGISTGDELMIQGPTTGVVTLTCDGMRLDESPIDTAKPGDEITLIVPAPVRRGDTAFVRVPQA
jgi:putative protease